MTIDARAPRFTAAMSTLVLVIVLVTGNGWLCLAQAAVFGLGTLDLRWSPYGAIYRVLIAPRLRPNGPREEMAPARFAQGVGLGFVVVATLGYLLGVPVIGMIAAGMALAATFLNAAFGFCCGCELYLRIQKLRRRSTG